MERFKGYKGKWSIRGYTTPSGNSYYIKQENEGTICYTDISRKEENRANIRLISKAPEMLKMLVDIANGRVISTKNVEDLINEATNIKGL